MSARNIHAVLGNDEARVKEAALKLAEKHGVSLPTVRAARELLRAVKSQGNGHIDSSAVVTVLESMANTTVGSRAKSA